MYPCHRAVALTPPEWSGASVSLRRPMQPSPYGRELGFLWGFHFSRPNPRSLSLRPDDLLTILKMALSIGIRNSISFLSAIQATRPLTITLAGLSPTEHTSFSWTRFRTVGFPQSGWKAVYQTVPSRRPRIPRDVRFAIRPSCTSLPVTSYPRSESRDAARLCTTVQAAIAALPQGSSLRPGCAIPAILTYRPHAPHSPAHLDFADTAYTKCLCCASACNA